MYRYFSLLLLFIAFSATGQIQNDRVFHDFLKNSPVKECLHELDSTDIRELLKSNIVYVNNHRVSIERKPGGTLTIDPYGLCNEYRSISIHYFKKEKIEHMFVYRRYAEARQEYGELQLYTRQNGVWEFGQQIDLGWQHFFSISKEEIDRLRNLNQYPNYIITFKENGIEFSIPWELYSFDQGSEINGYVQGHGKHPLLLTYENLLPGQ